jgi:hypothetical protein
MERPKKRGRPRKISALPQETTVAVAGEKWRKNVHGAFVVGDCELTPAPVVPDPIFPSWALLINEIVPNAFKMRFAKRLAASWKVRDLLVEIESKVCEAYFLKGPQITFLDGNPAGLTTLTMIVDGQKVLDRAYAKDFTSPDPKLDFSKPLPWKDGIPSLFTAGADTKEQERIGLFLPNGSEIIVHVDTEREVEIRLVMAEYTTRFGGQ